MSLELLLIIVYNRSLRVHFNLTKIILVNDKYNKGLPTLTDMGKNI